MKTLKAKNILSKVIQEYSFSIEADLIEELNNELEYEINKISTAEGTEGETKESEEAEGEEGETEEAEGIGGETEGVPEVVGAQGNDNKWLFYFLTTNVNKDSNIMKFGIEEEY